MRGARRVARLVGALAVVTCAPCVPCAPAFADAADVAHARAQFEEALRHEDAGRWQAALALLLDVARTRTSPQVRYHIGHCLERLGRLVEAAQAFALAEEEAQSSSDPDQQIVAARAGQRAALIRARAPRFVLDRDDETVTIRIDGVVVRPVARTIAVDPGRRVLRVERGGAVLVTREVTMAEQDPAQVVTVELPRDVDKPASSARGPEASPVSPPIWIAGGVALAALGGSGVTALLRADAISDLDEACGASRALCPESARGVHDRAETLTTLTNVLLVTGGIAAITGATLWLLSRSTATPTSTSLQVRF